MRGVRASASRFDDKYYFARPQSFQSFPLANIYRLNAAWLNSGEGDMFLHTVDALSEIRDEGRLDKNYIRLLKAMKDHRVGKLMFARLQEAFVYLGIDI